MVIISWDTLPGKRYTLLNSPILTSDSWLATDVPQYGEGQPIAITVTLNQDGGIPPDRYFWRVAIDDVDSDDDGLADHEEFLLGLNPSAGQTYPGITDLWIGTYFPNTASAFDPNHAPHANGLTYQEMHDLGLNPNQEVAIGPMNFAFSEDLNSAGIVKSFRDPNPPESPEPHDPYSSLYHPSDLYAQGSVPGWQAALGEFIEIWDENKEPRHPNDPTPSPSPYVELQAHFGAKGIKQQFYMLPGTTLAFLLRYKGRYDGYDVSNPFKLKVEGAHELLVNGQLVQAQQSVKEKVFMNDDEWGKYAEWQDAFAVITADPQATTLVPITLNLIPEDTSESITYGSFVNLLPVEIDYIDPEDSTWQIEATDGLVYLNDKSVKVRIRIQGIEMSKNQLLSSELGEIRLKSSFTGAGFQETILSVSDPVCEVVTQTGYTEIRITIPEIDKKRLNLLPSAGELDLTVYSILDYISDEESNLTDSQAFIDSMKNGLMGQPAGYAHNQAPTDLTSQIPHSQPDGTFLQAAGCEVLKISFRSASKSTQIMNQGEIFYYSGHGYVGSRATGPQFQFSHEYTIDGSELKKYWNDDLNLVVIAGCSVVNVNNWNPNPAYFPATTGPDTDYYPGEFMNLSGPRFVLGYGSSAPRDTQNAGLIASTFVSEYLANSADPFSAWRTANDNSNGRNATAIERNLKFGYFERQTLFGITYDYIWKTTPFDEW